ncbi:MAG: hypothetical protein WC745_03170 [Patescibacteria group bacterium]|jgi:hypothetical protein
MQAMLTAVCICAGVAWFLSGLTKNTIKENGFWRGLGILLLGIVTISLTVVATLYAGPYLSYWVIRVKFVAMSWHPLGGAIVSIICNWIIITILSVALYWIADRAKSKLMENVVICAAIFCGIFLTIDAIGITSSSSDIWGWTIVLCTLIGTTVVLKKAPDWWYKDGKNITGVPVWLLINHVAGLYIALSRGWDYYQDIRGTAYTACVFLVAHGLAVWYAFGLSDPKTPFWHKWGAWIQVPISIFIWYFLIQTLWLQGTGQLTIYTFELTREATSEARVLERMEREANAKDTVSEADRVYWDEIDRWSPANPSGEIWILAQEAKDQIYWTKVAAGDPTDPKTWVIAQKAADKAYWATVAEGDSARPYVWIKAQRAKVTALKDGVQSDRSIPQAERIKSLGEERMDDQTKKWLSFPFSGWGNKSGGGGPTSTTLGPGIHPYITREGEKTPVRSIRGDCRFNVYAKTPDGSIVRVDMLDMKFFPKDGRKPFVVTHKGMKDIKPLGEFQIEALHMDLEIVIEVYKS